MLSIGATSNVKFSLDRVVLLSLSKDSSGIKDNDNMLLCSETN